MTTTPPAPFTLPRPVGAVLARLPAYPGSVLLVTAINLALARHLPDDVKALLKDKRLSIRVRDARLAFDFSWNGQRFAPSAPQANPDLAISANAQDFMLLAQRRQDPDTLFFNRRLVMEGDTAHWTPRAVLARRAPHLARQLPPLPPIFGGRP
jgi:predicted lipid carrier protein YhbT